MAKIGSRPMAAAAVLALAIPQCLSLQVAYVLTLEDHNMIMASIPPGTRFRGYPEVPQSTGWAERVIAGLLDTSMPVFAPNGPCPTCPLYQCKAPQVRPWPLLPLSEAERNALLVRGPPDVVRDSIQRATRGELSTVEEVVARAMEALTGPQRFSALRDDELALLATNFAKHSNGAIAGSVDMAMDYGEWDEDFLIPDDEQRVLQAAYAHVLSDKEFRMRGEDALGLTELRNIAAAEREKAGEHILEHMMVEVKGLIDKFQEKQNLLGKEFVVSEQDWVRRYEDNIGALEADLYQVAMKYSGAMSPESMETMQNLVQIAQEESDEYTCNGVHEQDPGFLRFRDEQQDGILVEFGPDLRESIVFRLAYRRWRVLSPEQQAGYAGER